MNAKQFVQMCVQAVVIGTITAVACSVAQRWIIGEVNPVITAAVTGAVAAGLLSRLHLGKETVPDQVAETE